MNIEIITKELQLDISGFSGVAINKNYAGTAFALMDKIWPVIKLQGLKHKGLNIWVYEPDYGVFAGVELEDPSIKDTGGLNKKLLCLQNVRTINILAHTVNLKKTATACEMSYIKWG